MPSVIANGITLEYESLGDEGAPVMLLVMGLGMQLVSWPDPFCQLLVQRGFRVLRFDNRDCGLSQKMDHLGKPHLAWPATPWDCSTRSGSATRTSSGPRWAA